MAIAEPCVQGPPDVTVLVSIALQDYMGKMPLRGPRLHLNLHRLSTARIFCTSVLLLYLSCLRVYSLDEWLTSYGKFDVNDLRSAFDLWPSSVNTYLPSVWRSNSPNVSNFL